MKKLLFSLIILTMVSFTSCEEEEEIKLAKLVVTVNNSSGTAQSGALVEVIDKAALSTEAEKTTSSNGKAEFTLQGDKIYSVIASKGSLSGAINISNILFKGDSYEITVIIK